MKQNEIKATSASILDGRYVATTIQKTIERDVKARILKGQRPPGLAVIHVGDDPASCIYVNAKRHACQQLGFHSFAYNLPIETSEHELLVLVDTLNETEDVDGILIQLPLPGHMHTPSIIERIKPEKDVDGFHPYNFGRLAQGNPGLRPCTPYGIIKLLNFYQIDLVGQHAVVVGCSNIVGRPMALEFLHAKSTVTVCHRLTRHLEQHIRAADIIVVGTGIPDVVKTDWLHQQQIVIDVGMHRLDDGRVRGEIDFHAAKNKVAWITPVPGGVGPMTICMLLHNTLLAANAMDYNNDSNGSGLY